MSIRSTTQRVRRSKLTDRHVCDEEYTHVANGHWIANGLQWNWRQFLEQRNERTLNGNANVRRVVPRSPTHLSLYVSFKPATGLLYTRTIATMDTRFSINEKFVTTAFCSDRDLKKKHAHTQTNMSSFSWTEWNFLWIQSIGKFHNTMSLLWWIADKSNPREYRARVAGAHAENNHHTGHVFLSAQANAI